MIDTNFIGKWFTGKSLEKASEAMVLLNESIAVGYWVGKASVKVPAALSKSNVAQKLSKKSSEINTMANTYGEGRVQEIWSVQHNLYFGSFGNMAAIDLHKAIDAVTTADAKMVIAKAMEFVSDFAEVVDAMAKLNKESEANKKLAKAKAEGNIAGICACCFKTQMVKPTGTMYKHGYQRPGWGYIIGGCPGEMFKPYSV